MVVRPAMAGPILTATSTGANSVTLTWTFTPPAGESLYALPTPTGPAQTAYLIERTDPSTGDFVSLLPAGTILTAKTYTDTSVSASATYGYRVFAVNNYYYGESPASNSQVVSLAGSGAVTVSPTSVVAIADSKYRAYGSANPAFTGNIIGTLPSGATISYSTTATSASPVGTYPITMTVNGVPANTVTSTSGTLTISAAPLTVAVDNQARLFNLANPTLTGTLSGVLNSDHITATYSTVGAASSPVGAYPIVAALVDPNSKLSNYSVTNTPGILDVTFYQLAGPQALTIQQGHVGTATITMTPLNGFTGAVTFSCGALPVATTCNFTQPQLTGNLENNPVSTSLVITTTGPNGTIAHRETPNRLKPLYGALGLSAFGIVLFGSGRKRRAAMLILLSVAFASLLLMPGCGGSGSSGIPQTPIGTSTFTVNVTASSAAAQSVAPNQQLQITLTVVR
jgi:hypothetical protein